MTYRTLHICCSTRIENVWLQIAKAERTIYIYTKRLMRINVNTLVNNNYDAIIRLLDEHYKELESYKENYFSTNQNPDYWVKANDKDN